MKGVELPINALIIIVLAIIVLVAIIALFYTGIKPPQNTLSAQAALDRACMKLHSYNCQVSWLGDISVDDFDADADGKLDLKNLVGGSDSCGTTFPFDVGDNLPMLCCCYFQICYGTPNWEEDCKKLCQC